VSVNSEIRDLFRRMPKAEMHLHLDGSLRPQTALELARERGIDEGMDLAAITSRLVGPAHFKDQAQLLETFDLPIAIMQDAESITRITHELVEDVASDGTRYAEIRWGPALHLLRDLDLHASIQAVVDGVRSGVAATGIHIRLIAVALRSHSPELNLAVALESAKFMDHGLTGFDLAGQEEAYPDPLVHRDAFEAARSAGLGITIHAGEWGGPAQVWGALAVGPSRIAHGSISIEDPELMEELKARSVTLDLCPTSNVQANTHASLAEHSLARLARAGVPVTLSTDDRTVSDLTLVREYENASREMGLSPRELWAMNMHALHVAFLHYDESLRAQLITEFEDFADQEPLLRGDVVH